MSGNMAFFFDLVALYLVALPGGSTWWLYLVALPGGSTWWLYLVALPGGSTWWLYLVALYLVALPGGLRPGASMCCTLHHSSPPITPPISHRKIRWDKVVKLW